LISVVPLYELDFRHDPPALTRVLFSDGGITSNFPVHFFDSPLPRRPTFGLNLIGFEPDEAPDPERPCDAVVPPAAPDRPGHANVSRIDDLVSFGVAIKDAAQNWRDNAQAQLPGYRDRIVHLKLAKGEGGLNLTMDGGKIQALNARGKCAGEALAERFASDRAVHWNDHRFVRYRTIMSLVERLLRAYGRGYGAAGDPATISYSALVPEHVTGPYAIKTEMQEFARTVTEAYLELVAGWDAGAQTFDDSGVPRPPSTLRAVPPV
jgi:hypothetical protein